MSNKPIANQLLDKQKNIEGKLNTIIIQEISNKDLQKYFFGLLHELRNNRVELTNKVIKPMQDEYNDMGDNHSCDTHFYWEKHLYKNKYYENESE